MLFNYIFLGAISAIILVTLVKLMQQKDEEIMQKLVLTPLGDFTQNGKTYDLNAYFIDRNRKLYSRNLDTWEINHKKGKDILICSDGSTDNSGHIINSLRTEIGDKVTIRRSNMNFFALVRRNGAVVLDVKPTGTRHLKINAVVERLA